MIRGFLFRKLVGMTLRQYKKWMPKKVKKKGTLRIVFFERR